MRNATTTTDLERCKRRINAVLKEFNCVLESGDDYSWVLLRDRDTDETTGMSK